MDIYASDNYFKAATNSSFSLPPLGIGIDATKPIRMFSIMDVECSVPSRLVTDYRKFCTEVHIIPLNSRRAVQGFAAPCWML